MAFAGVLYATETRAQTPTEFWKHWSDGKAEINAYSGTQSRYGETRASQNALIFVTEPFNADKQVKADAPERNNPMYPNVLKLNRVKRFQTGIYAYSIMTSVFTPLSPARARSVVWRWRAA